MKKKCNCYYVYKGKRYTYHPITGQRIVHDVERGICNGTRERDECSCGGDETKCDFYPEIRERAKKELKKVITNGDNIRSVNDEQLAELLVYKVKCTGCNAENCDEKFCLNLMKEWIKHSYEET